MISSFARDEVVAARARVGDGPGIIAALVEDDAVRPGRAARVGLVGGQDGELLVGPVYQEVEALVVVEGVGVVVAADGVARLEQPARGFGG